jgi:hypothetical protein
MTRKRQKLIHLQDKLQGTQEKLNLELSQSFQFDPILESIAQFFCLKECAMVANLNHRYHSKTWFYILHSSSRLENLNDLIQLDTKSLTWIKKYRLHLKYQKIEVSSNEVIFDLSLIPQCLSLCVEGTRYEYPNRVKQLILSQYDDGKFPNVNDVETLCVLVYNDSNLNILSTCPNTIKTLRIRPCFIFDGTHLPFLPNLETFQCESTVCNIAQIEQKFPNLTTLEIVSCYAVLQMEKLSFFKHRLIIESYVLTNTDMFTNFQCHELDLSKCTNMIDYSAVAHIPIVKRFEKKKKPQFLSEKRIFAPYFYFSKMLTRKRQKLLDSQEVLNLEMSTRVFQFDPILESITQFSPLQSCARIARLSHSYHGKTWMYILNSSHRLSLLNHSINLDHKSLTWISKYRMHLKYQHIQVARKIKFDLSIIPQLDSLNVYEPIVNFPGQVKHLTLSGFTEINTFPNITGVETLFVPHYDSHCKLLKTCPQTITKIKIQSAWWFNCLDLPDLQNLETLFLRVDSMKNVQTIQEKFPNLTNLHIISDNLHGIEELENFRGKLMIECNRLITTSIFANFKTQELDLSHCPKIFDYSSLVHIPNVKRFEKK